MASGKEKPIIYFDGVCGLCSEFVDFVMAIDKKQVHMFTPLQGRTAEKTLSEFEREDLDSVVLIQDGVKYKKSAAVFKIFTNIGGPWSMLAGFSVLPVFVTDAAYGIVAKIRYKLFGKKESCRLPTPAERARFLD